MKCQEQLIEISEWIIYINIYNVGRTLVGLLTGNFKFKMNPQEVQRGSLEQQYQKIEQQDIRNKNGNIHWDCWCLVL